MHTWVDMQYRYEEHQGDDVAAADTDEPNLLAVRLLWSSTTVSSTVWSGLPLMWLIFQQSIAVEGIVLLYKGNFALVQQAVTLVQQ